LSSIDSASNFFSRRFSSSSAFSRRASETSNPPYFAFHLYSVALEMPCRRQSSSGLAPASCSRSTPMICSSLKRLLSSLVSLFRRRTLPHFGGVLGAHANRSRRAMLLSAPYELIP
jgi:hypothetical protein